MRQIPKAFESVGSKFNALILFYSEHVWITGAKISLTNFSL
jgi:hypothetical protein